MPVWRYFLFTGSVLLGLLFILDAYLPPASPPSSEPEVDHSFIRVHAQPTQGSPRYLYGAAVTPLRSAQGSRAD